MRARAFVFVFLLPMAVAEASTPFASADDTMTREQARQAYERGTQARRRGDYAEAAADFARADELAPTPAALSAALDDAVRADDPALGMQLVERASRDSTDAGLAASATVARDKFKGRAGRITVHCPPAQSCVATLDGKVVDATRSIWTLPAEHTLIVQVGDAAQTRLVGVKADETVDVTPAATPEPAASTSASAPPASSSSPPPQPVPLPATSSAESRAVAQDASTGLSPTWTWIGTGATALLAGASLISGIDTANKHRDFGTNSCAQTGSPTCDTISSQGASAQMRTNVLVGATVGVGLVTVVVAFFFTRWSTHESSARGRLSPRPGGFSFEF